MGAVGYLARRGLRASRGGWLLVIVLTALTIAPGGGALMVAQETLRAHPRLLDALGAPDLTLGIGNPEDPDPTSHATPEQLLAIGGVQQLTIVRNTIGTELDAQDRPDPDNMTGLLVPVRGDPTVPLLRGRLPEDDATDEVAISAGAVQRLRADVGDRIRYAVLSRGGTVVEPVVVGVFGPTVIDGPPDAPAGGSLILASPAFFDAYPGAGTYQVASVWLRDDATVGAFRRSLEDRFGATLDISTRSEDEASVRRAVQPEAIAVMAFGLAVGLAGAVITAQAIGRQLSGDRDARTLLATGVSRRQRAAERWLQAAAAIAVGAVGGLVGSIAVASAIGPIGIANAFAPAGGREPNATTALLNASIVALVLASFAVLSAWRGAAVQPDDNTGRPRLTASLLGAAPGWLRTSLALAGGGSAGAARAAIVGTATSVMVLVTFITFGASVDALVSTPALYGHDYDLAAWDGYGAIDDDVISETLLADDDVEHISRAAGSGGTVGGREADLIGLDDLTIGPTRTSGRDPAGADEVLVGRRLARRLGLQVGDDVVVAVGDQDERYEVVGTGVVPGGGGDGVAFTLDGLWRVAPDSEVGNQYVQVRDGTDPRDVVRRFVDAFGGCPEDCDIAAPSPPTDIAYLDRVGSLPRWSAAAMLAVGVAMTIHALVLVGRRSRRSIAILRSLGATRWQAARCLLTEALLIALTAAVIGVVLGVVAGRAVWRLFADELGVVPAARTSWMVTSVSVAGLILLAVLVASVPSWLAARRPVAIALRTD